MRNLLLCGAALLVGLVALGGTASGQSATCFELPATIVGTPGDDFLVGTEGNDVIVGLGGNDTLHALGGNDTLCGGPGNDAHLGGAGDDRMDGGGGGFGPGFIDGAHFELAAQPVRADLRAGTATGEGTDRLVNITLLSGTPFGDAFIGDGAVNTFFPGGGNDSVDGGGGDDLVGFDRGVTVNLATGTATGEGDDRLVAVESISGSDFPDVLTGGGGGNYIGGNEGDDVIRGGPGSDRLFGDEGADRVFGENGDDRLGGNAGNDSLSGGGGSDRMEGGVGDDALQGDAGLDLVAYLGSARGVQANLLVGRAAGDGTDELAAVENVDGSAGRDQMLGDGGINFLYGYASADTLAGGGESDFLEGGAAASSLSGGAGTDYCLSGRGAARCEIAGAPSIPVVTDQPPASLTGPVGGVVYRQRPVVMAAPSGSNVNRDHLERLRAMTLRMYAPDEPQVRQPRDEWALVSPLEQLFESAVAAGTGVFRYSGQPSCVVSRRPYRTTVGPPVQLDPAIRDGAREQAYWRGVLFRRAPNGKLARFRSTPWLTALIQGENVPTGFPNWLNARQTDFISSLTFSVPAGNYTWAGVIKWIRTGGRVQGHIAPHNVFTPKLQPDKSCTFG